MAKETQRQCEERPDGDPTTSTEAWLRCTACGHAIARPASRMSVDGKHVHSFVNPAGLAFTIACLADAPGCEASGQESTFFTWFPGHAWRIALCGGCGAHVGWSFRRDAAGFWGLIVERVA